MLTSDELLSAVIKTQIGSQIASFFTLTAKAVDNVVELIELNLRATRSVIDITAATMRQVLAAQDPQAAVSVSHLQVQPVTERALAYGRHVSTILSMRQAECARTLEAQVAQYHQQINRFIDNVSKAAPAGSEQPKATFGGDHAGYEQLSTSSRQATQVMQANVEAVTARFSKAALRALQQTTGAG